MFAGDLHGAIAALDRGVEAFESPTYRARRLRVGTDPRVSCLAASGFILFLLGYPDRAVERSNRGVAIAREADPYSLAYGLFHSAFLHLWRSEPLLVQERASQLLEVVADHDFPIWRAVGTVLTGASEAFLGRPADGLAKVSEGMAQYQGMRSPPIFWPFLRFVQAATLAGAGQLTEALAILDELLETEGDHASGALFHLVQGDVRFGLGGTAGSPEASYQTSLEMARRMSGMMVELQAETRLLRYRRALGETDDGSALRAVYDRFTEGFETRDLVEARELLG